METPTSRTSSWLVYGLIALGIVSRLVPHPWNATPVMAIALFAGTYLSKRWAILLPLIIVAVSDLIIGWHNTVPFTWGAFLLTGLLAWGIRSRPTATRVLAGALGGSLLFFVLTNFGVWVAGGLYPRTIAGLWECYVAAIPFFRGTLVGDLLYTAMFFVGYNAVTHTRLARQSAP